MIRLAAVQFSLGSGPFELNLNLDYQVWSRGLVNLNSIKKIKYIKKIKIHYEFKKRNGLSWAK